VVGVAGFEPAASSSRTVGALLLAGVDAAQLACGQPLTIGVARLGCCTFLLCSLLPAIHFLVKDALPFTWNAFPLLPSTRQAQSQRPGMWSVSDSSRICVACASFSGDDAGGSPGADDVNVGADRTGGLGVRIMRDRI
jgi:hypothetical protein